MNAAQSGRETVVRAGSLGGWKSAVRWRGGWNSAAHWPLAALAAISLIAGVAVAEFGSAQVFHGTGIRVALEAVITLLALIAAVLLATRLRVARRVEAAVSAERVRIAHDLHDGLAQDLAFIAVYADEMERKFEDGGLLAVAARRALAASRGAIVDLAASKAPTTADALREVAAESRARFGVQITVRVAEDTGPEPSATQRAELVRIGREAIANAVRHGGAQHVTVTLGSPDDDVLLRITDDGCGFGAAEEATAGTGLGMGAMRDRASRLGARVRVGRGEHGGAAVDVVVL